MRLVLYLGYSVIFLSPLGFCVYKLDGFLSFFVFLYDEVYMKRGFPVLLAFVSFRWFIVFLFCFRSRCFCLIFKVTNLNLLVHTVFYSSFHYWAFS